jgi:hypothetical protein
MSLGDTPHSDSQWNLQREASPVDQAICAGRCADRSGHLRVDGCDFDIVDRHIGVGGEDRSEQPDQAERCGSSSCGR